MKTIAYGRQSISERDIEAVVRVLRSDWLTQGPEVQGFEAALAQYCGAAAAVAMHNATLALHAAYLALDLGPGDVLWTSPITFVATANGARACGADVDFVDIDPDSLNLSPARLAEKLSVAKRTGRLPKIVAPVHFTGLPCDMQAIGALSREYGFRVVEDAAHAIGAKYGSYAVGACTHSDAAVFSFHPVKIVTTAEGGAVLTRDRALAARLDRIRNHGLERSPEAIGDHWEGPWHYEMRELGFNYRMTDMQAALGASQLKQIEAFIARRHTIADRYDRELARLPLALPRRSTGSRSALHLYVIQVDEARTKRTRREVFDRLRAAGIWVQVHYIPVHLQPYYRKLGFSPGQFPAAERFYRGAISLPIHAGLSDDDQARVIDELGRILA